MKYLSALFFPIFLFAGPFTYGNSLQGYFYGDKQAPSGKEWQSPDSLALNKEQPRAIFWSFESLDKALKVLPENSEYWLSLDGEWSFSWVRTPELRPQDFYKPEFDVSAWDTIDVPSNWNIAGIGKDGSLKYGKPIYVNQPVIFWHEVKPGDWQGGVMRTPPQDWTTYEDRNEVGSYRRTFTIPSDWKGREVYINFDGVDSFFYLWINGHYVGYSKNSRNAARFDITRFLEKGENTVAVEVYRNSDGSFLEAQDMFRLPGIFRSVSLYSTPKVQISDLKIIPDLTNNYQDGRLDITTSLRNISDKNVKDLTIEYLLYANKLYSDDHENNSVTTVSTSPFNLIKEESTQLKTSLEVSDPNKWSAEEPWRYTLVARLKDKKGKVIETVSTYVGFRKVEILDTPGDKDEFGNPGRYFYVNGQPVKLKGVNRHETSPSSGHAIGRQQMLEEVMLMKKANINHVRNSHYPDDPYWYYLAEKYGLYLEDEANLESHEYYYGKASLSHVPEWEPAHVARNMEMVKSRINSPAVVIWSLGNEAGPGDNFIAAYNAIKDYDTSRPVQYERNNDIVDMGSNQYPSIPWVQEAAKGKMDIKYPFHISEYAHSMGNAVGNLVDYWNAIESSNHIMGGAIWDWVDQSIYFYDKATGERYLAFGGDFGDYPSDGQFVMNGILFGDLQPKPQYWEVKKVYQNVGITPVKIDNGIIEVFNKNYFTSLEDYTIEWNLIENGDLVEKGILPDSIGKSIMPRQKKILNIPFNKSVLKPDKEYFLNVYLKLNEDKPWADKGYVQISEQIPLNNRNVMPVKANRPESELKIMESDSTVKVEGTGFSIEFDNLEGGLSGFRTNNKDLIIPGKGTEIDVFRAVMNNDVWIADQWMSNGLYNLQHKVLSKGIHKDSVGNVEILYTIESQAPRGGKMVGGNGNPSGIYSIKENEKEYFGPDDFKIITNQIWTVYKDGVVELNSFIDSNKPNLTLPRVGYSLEIPDSFNLVEYYGRGPEENYADRKSSQFIGKYRKNVNDLVTDYTRPQSNGNREDVRWAAFTDGEDGILFIAPETMSFSAGPYSEMDLFKSDHPYKLPESNTVKVHLDAGVTGLGGASCGQGGPLPPDRMSASNLRFTLMFTPVTQENLEEKVTTERGGSKPIGISRDRAGIVTIDYPTEEEILYITDSSSKPISYSQPFNFKNGGRIKAWVKNKDYIQTEVEFNKIETIPLAVVYASSEEPDYGEASHLVDDNPSSIWHTMYSVTVAKFPHWVDFDMGESKPVKGFTYLPRQGASSTGMIKDYEIYLSDSLEEWGEPVVKGELDSTKDKKTILLDKPATGRYVRFKALNAHDGREYASGAGFEVMEN